MIFRRSYPDFVPGKDLPERDSVFFRAGVIDKSVGKDTADGANIQHA